jgi:hypothetical protein
LAKKTAERPFVYLHKVEFREDDPVCARLPQKMKALKELAKTVLALKRDVQQIFDSSNKPIPSVKSIQPGTHLYVSCAAPPVDDSELQIFKSRLPLESVAHPTIKLGDVEPPKPKPKPDDAAQHQAVASSPLTLRENTRLSLLTLYASLTPEQKQALSASSALQKLTADSQQFSLYRLLLSQFIGPTSAVMQTEYGRALPPFLIEKFKGLKPSDFKFAITGPSKSGKSTLPWAAATVFCQKLQISGDHENYLLFPINWLVHQLVIDDVPRLYRLIVTTAIASLKSMKLQFVPVLDLLQQWLLSIVAIPTLPAFPPPVLHVASFPKDIVFHLGQRIHKHRHQRSDFAAFVRALLAAPSDLAAAFFPFIIKNSYRLSAQPSSPSCRRDIQMIHIIELIWICLVT